MTKAERKALPLLAELANTAIANGWDNALPAYFDACYGEFDELVFMALYSPEVA